MICPKCGYDTKLATLKEKFSKAWKRYKYWPRDDPTGRELAKQKCEEIAITLDAYKQRRKTH